NEVNERMHGKLCDKIFRQVIERVKKHDDPYYFLEEAQHQNNRLKDGHVSGWCAHALLKLAQAYETEKKLQNAQELFHAQLKTLLWDELHKLSRAMMKLRRAGERITKKSLFGITESETGLRLVAQDFEATDGKEFSAKEKTAVRKPAPSKQVYDIDLPPILSHLREEE